LLRGLLKFRMENPIHSINLFDSKESVSKVLSTVSMIKYLILSYFTFLEMKNFNQSQVCKSYLTNYKL